MDERDLEVRTSTYRLFVELGRAPTVDEVADESGLATDEALSRWRRLNGQHDLVLHPATADPRLRPFWYIVRNAHVTGRDERLRDESLFFHCLVPAARWCDDIVCT
jgi:hypothetical protein